MDNIINLSHGIIIKRMKLNDMLHNFRKLKHKCYSGAIPKGLKDFVAPRWQNLIVGFMYKLCWDRFDQQLL